MSVRGGFFHPGRAGAGADHRPAAVRVGTRRRVFLPAEPPRDSVCRRPYLIDVIPLGGCPSRIGASLTGAFMAGGPALRTNEPGGNFAIAGLSLVHEARAAA